MLICINHTYYKIRNSKSFIILPHNKEPNSSQLKLWIAWSVLDCMYHCTIGMHIAHTIGMRSDIHVFSHFILFFFFIFNKLWLPFCEIINVDWMTTWKMQTAVNSFTSFLAHFFSAYIHEFNEWRKNNVIVIIKK